MEMKNSVTYFSYLFQLQGVGDSTNLSPDEDEMVKKINDEMFQTCITGIRSNIDRGLPERTIEIETEIIHEEMPGQNPDLN